VQILITVKDDSPHGQRLLPWLTNSPAARQATLTPAGEPGQMGAADILGTVSDIAGLTALIFQTGAWWLARSRQPGTTPPGIVIEYNGVRVTLENADADHLNQIITALVNGNQPGGSPAVGGGASGA
jgi:hypothetical protein